MLEGRAAQDLLAQCRGVDAQRRPGPHDRGAQHRIAGAQQQGQADHAFAADQRHFETLAVLGGGDADGDDRAGRVIGVGHRVAGPHQDVGEAEAHRFAGRQEVLAVWRRQARQQLVGGRGLVNAWGQELLLGPPAWT
jgi:hypothetical protein